MTLRSFLRRIRRELQGQDLVAAATEGPGGKTSGETAPVDTLEWLPANVTGVPILCPRCGVFVIVRRDRISDISCLQCWKMLQSGNTAQAAQQAKSSLHEALRARTARIRLRWYAGYVSDYPDLPDEDTQAVMLNPQSGLVTLHAMTGGVHRFRDSSEKDEEGFTLYDEIFGGEQAEYVPVAPSRALLPFAETFDYVAVMPATGRDGRCYTRSADAADQHAKGHRLVGWSPHLHIESAGMLRGGGPLSPLCDLNRPAVLASRIVLAAHDRAEATTSAAWFSLDQGLVDVLRAGDEVHMTRTPRGGLGVSVIRGDDLIVALGAVTAVPLGGNLKVAVRRDRLARGEPPDGGSNTGYPWQHPIEITSGGRVPRKPKGYTIQVWYSVWPPPEDADECVSIIRIGACPTVAAFASTQLLAMTDALHVQAWPIS